MLKQKPTEAILCICRLQTSVITRQYVTSGSMTSETIHLRPRSFETTFIWDHVHLRPWAQFAGGHGGSAPHFFRRRGQNMLCPPTFFSSGFVCGELSKIKVMFVTFCVMSFSC